MDVAAGTALALDAPAKVNLSLRVTGKRDDGYHLLESIVAFTDAGDRVYVAPPSEVGELLFAVEGPFADGIAGDPSENLVYRAASGLRAAARAVGGARLRLVKNLPVAAGIGGGSSDAAATLRLMAGYWGVPNAAETIGRLAAQLGADVPVCLLAAPARFTGIGDVVEPIAPLPACGVVLVNAGVPVPTPDVFAARSGEPFSPEQGWAPPGSFDDLVESLQARGNDLTDAACTVSPAIGGVLDQLSRSPGCRLARLSGSGGTCFGLYTDADTAAAAAAAIADARPEWWVVSTAFRTAAPEIERV